MTQKSEHRRLVVDLNQRLTSRNRLSPKTMGIIGRSEGDEPHHNIPSASTQQNGGASPMTLKQGGGDIGHYYCMSFVAFRNKSA